MYLSERFCFKLFTLYLIAVASSFEIKPFRVDFGKDIPHLKTLVNHTRLPSKPILTDPNSTFGISVETLRGLQNSWGVFDWEAEERVLNSYKQFTTTIEGLTIHFVHEKSRHPGAIPIIISHGWPGSFHEYLPVVDPLLQSAPASNSSGKSHVSFDVVIPSLPGFTFSSPPPDGWSINDTARIWNTLMVDVLGYDKGYAVAGSDWGGGIAWTQYDLFNTTVRAALVTFFPFLPPTADQVRQANQTLSPFQQQGLERAAEWSTTGNSYFLEQTTKPSTIGLALQDNPVGQLAWMAEKFLAWSDPLTGELNSTDILTSVSLYYLSQSFLSSCYIYAQNPRGFAPVGRKARTAAPLAYSNFKYDVGHWPECYAAELGNLVSYREHENGGHFPGLDNPVDWVQDVRDMMGGHFWFLNEGDSAF